MKIRYGVDDEGAGKLVGQKLFMLFALSVLLRFDQFVRAFSYWVLSLQRGLWETGPGEPFILLC